jgi:hypothetical protein
MVWIARIATGVVWPTSTTTGDAATYLHIGNGCFVGRTIPRWNSSLVDPVYGECRIIEENEMPASADDPKGESLIKRGGERLQRAVRKLLRRETVADAVIGQPLPTSPDKQPVEKERKD